MHTVPTYHPGDKIIQPLGRILKLTFSTTGGSARTPTYISMRLWESLDDTSLHSHHSGCVRPAPPPCFGNKSARTIDPAGGCLNILRVIRQNRKKCKCFSTGGVLPLVFPTCLRGRGEASDARRLCSRRPCSPLCFPAKRGQEEALNRRRPNAPGHCRSQQPLKSNLNCHQMSRTSTAKTIAIVNNNSNINNSRNNTS